MDTKDSGKTNEEVPSLIRSEPTQCIGGCGFYGSASTANYCSSCFKKANAEVKKEESVVPVVETKKEETKVELKKEPRKKKRKVQKNKKRCFSCRKKLGFTGVECRCGYIYCGDHRYAEAHACDFDYSGLNKKILEEKNPHCRHAKVEKL